MKMGDANPWTFGRVPELEYHRVPLNLESMVLLEVLEVANMVRVG